MRAKHLEKQLAEQRKALAAKEKEAGGLAQELKRERAAVDACQQRWDACTVLSVINGCADCRHSETSSQSLSPDAAQCLQRLHRLCGNEGSPAVVQYFCMSRVQAGEAGLQ